MCVYRVQQRHVSSSGCSETSHGVSLKSHWTELFSQRHYFLKWKAGVAVWLPKLANLAANNIELCVWLPAGVRRGKRYHLEL